MFLEKILAFRRQLPSPTSEQLACWQAEAARQGPARGFLSALRKGPAPRIIAEFKRASPSKGVLNPRLQPEAQARAYEAGGASAISVLTEPEFFQGSPEDLKNVRAACALPVLRKDFLLHDWEVVQSRSWGADAVLLIAAALPAERLARMLELCQQVGLDALVEVHSVSEAQTVMDLGAPLVGINNRDLQTFAVDLEVSRRVAAMLPPETVKVAESGFETADQIQSFPGVDAFLIGETLVRAEEPAQCLRQLRGFPIPLEEIA